MLSQRAGKWETAALDHPYGRGAMFQVYVANIDPVQRSLEAAGWPLYAGPREVWREIGDRRAGQREIFVLDPDGYLVMVAHDLVERPLLKEFVVRPARPGDLPDLRQAIVELQEYERRLHTTRLPGEQIADAYLAWLQQQAATIGGVLVAEVAGKFAGFATGWIVEEGNLGETADSNRAGYVSDICVMPAYRGHRVAGELLSAIERRLAGTGITRCASLRWPRTLRRRRPISEPATSRTRLSLRSALGADRPHELMPISSYGVPALVAAARGRASIRFLGRPGLGLTSKMAAR
jgi:GNAT superfamily N-acetyltransferase